MARRRYISTDISTDKIISRLVAEAGDFAALLYTWMIPHAEDDGSLTGDPEELVLRVIPGLRHRTPSEVATALEAMERLGLIFTRGGRVYFPASSFYKYQTYIRAENRRSEELPPPATNSEEHRTSAQNAVSVSSSLSPSDNDDAGACEDTKPLSWRKWYEHTFVSWPSAKWGDDLDRMVAGGMSHELIVATLDAKRGTAAHPLSAACSDLGTMFAAGVRGLVDVPAYQRRLSEAEAARRAPPQPAAAPSPPVKTLSEQKAERLARKAAEYAALIAQEGKPRDGPDPANTPP